MREKRGGEIAGVSNQRHPDNRPSATPVQYTRIISQTWRTDLSRARGWEGAIILAIRIMRRTTRPDYNRLVR